MRKNLCLPKMMLFGMSALFIGCQENEMIDSTIGNQKETSASALHQYGVFPQSEEFKSQSRSSNTTFETDWENYSIVTSATGQPINLPWSDEPSINFNKVLACDIKKEDGWQMLYHSLAGSGNVDNKHYIILYNQRTGFMKIFAYAFTMPPNNTGFWFLNFSANQQMLNATTEIALPADMGNISNWRSSNSTTLPYASFLTGWNVCQVQLAYEPNTIQNQFLGITTGTQNLTLGQLLGNFQSYSEGTVLTHGSTNPLTSLVGDLATVIGNEAGNYIADSLINSRSLLGGVTSSVLKFGLNKITGVH